MNHKKQNTNDPVKHNKNLYDLEYYWTDAYSEVFEPNRKRLLQMHKVPKFKQRLAQN